jgi:2-polyprenyl-3-methyl-5-hydroxy-6-metoxy-1,4-benzoquinol methylase
MSILCPQCDCEASPRCVTRDWNARVSNEPFHYFRCAACGLVWLYPVPGDLQRFYTRDYIAYTVPGSTEELRRQARLYVGRLEHVNRLVSSGSLLEIGPSYGAFASLAKDAGYQVSAIEMDPRCCAFLKNVLGIQVEQSSDIQEAIAKSGLYDVIVLWHVIEHLPDALSLLPTLAAHVAPGGILALSTPNPEALQFRFFGPYWVHLDAPRHALLVPLQLLDKMLGAAGMQRVFLTWTDPEAIALNRYGWMCSTRNWLSVPMFKYSRFVLGHMFRLILGPWERTEGQGTAYTVIYQRPQSGN